MRERERERVHGRRVRVGAALLAIVLAACSGSGGETGSSNPSSTTVGATSSSTDPGTTVAGAEPSVTAPPATTTPDSAATTTTEPPPAIVPLGVRWEEVGAIAETPAGGSPPVNRSELVTVGSDLWALNTVYNTSVATRSRDDGLTWETVPVVSPPPSGTLFLNGLVAGPTGRLVATGSVGNNCRSDRDLGNGYRFVELCRRFRPALVVSDDDGASWRQIEPAAMAPPGDSSMRVDDITVTDAGYLAVGTVLGPDWHARVWSSTDGENWTVGREFRDVDGGPMSGRQILADGATLVLVADGHPCGTPYADTPSGWVLGSSWASHLRLFSGASVGDLAVLSTADHPFVHDPEPVDCDNLTTVSDVSAFDAAYPQASGAVIGGVITMLRELDPFDPDEDDDDDLDQLTSGSRYFTQLVDGEWTLTEVDGVFSHNKVFAGGSNLIDVGGLPGMFEIDSTGSTVEFVPILPDGTGRWRQSVPERPAFTSQRGSTFSGVWTKGALVAVATVHSDPYRTDFGPPNVTSAAAWRSVETTGERVDPCDLGRGKTCRYTDLSMIDGYPDFAGIDLSGADLAFSDVGDADFTGADFTGATLWGISSGEGSSFDGANFTDARLETARLHRAVGADLTRANAYLTSIDDGTDAIFDGTNLKSADLRFLGLPALGSALIENVDLEQIPPDDSTAAYEISLAGLDLRFVGVSNAFEGPLLKVVSLDGSTLDFTSFSGVDLTAIDPAAIDLTEARVDEDSLCPDGQPPDGSSSGGCVRGDATP